MLRVRPVPISKAQQLFRQSERWLTGFCGGRGAGKTRVGCIHVSQKAKPGDPWMIVSPDNNMIRDTTLPSFLDTVKFSGQYIDHVLSPTPRVWFRTIYGGKADVVFKGAEVPDKLRGPNKAGVWFDEASIISQQAFQLAIAVCRHRGKMGPAIATFTPRGFKHWTFESFYERVDETLIGTKKYPAELIEWFQGRAYIAKPDTLLVRCATRENPFAPPEYVGRIAQQYSSTMSLQELEGDFVEISGLIFKREWFAQTVSHAPAIATRVRYWDKASCFIKGTLVTTQRGSVPIDKVTTSDKVLTRDGWKEISFAGPTKLAKSLVTVVFDDGTHITCTPEHRIWCNKTHGWIEAKALNGYSKCVTHSTTTEEELSCPGLEIRSLRKSILTESATQEIPVAKVSVGSDISTPTHGIKRKSVISINATTGMCGRTSGEKSPTAIISTILTATGTTTTYRIFSASCQASTGKNTRLICLAQKLSRKQERLLLGRRISSEKYRSSVKNAERAIVPGARLLSTARNNVCAKVDQYVREQSVSGRYQGVMNAGSAERNSQFTERKFTAQRHAPKSFATEGQWKFGAVVYDLAIKDGPPEFFANGTLVHNSADKGCFTVGTLMARDDRGLYYIEDVTRGQWSAHERNQIMLQTARADASRYCGTVLTFIEQEGGGDGKTVADQLIVMLSEFPVYRDVVSGSKWKTVGNTRLPHDAKVRRALPLAAQSEAGNIRLVDGKWPVADWLDEMTLFPEYTYADCVDSASGAFNCLQRLSPTNGPGSSRETEAVDSSRFGQAVKLSGGDSIAQWSDLPWNQAGADAQSEY